jgi:TonB family protein
MSVLFDDARLSTRSPGRWTSGLWLSVGVHAIAVGLIVVAIGAPGTPPTPRRSTRVFLPAMLPSAPVVTPRLPDPPAPPPAREIARAEPPKPLPPAPIVTKPVEAVPEPLVQPTVPAVERPIEKPEAPRPVETGLFERTNAARANQADAAITTGGFGSAAASTRSAAHGSVTTGGFGSGAPAPRGTVQGQVQTAGFDQRASAPTRPTVAATKPIDRPVEIVFKPTPEYTDEARSARIEGTVSLELEFTAAGDVRVLRIVRGLGHGLDEAAQRAALRIRFKPAQSDAGPVDSRATVHITFRLS